MQSINKSNRFPTFKPEGDLHPVIFLKSFESMLPHNWDETKKINFVIGHLEAEAAEILHKADFVNWEDFSKYSKEKYWLEGEQQKLTLELLDPTPYARKWGGFKKYVEWHLNCRHFVDIYYSYVNVCRREND